MAYLLPPAAIFTFLYFLAFAWYIKSLKLLVYRTQICYAITFFCLLRFVSFTIRVALAAKDSPAHADALVATQDILLHAGFLFLLYPTYILILKLEKFTQATTRLPPPSPILNLLRIRSFFRLALLIGATLRIMAVPHTHSNSDHDWAPETILALDRASASVFAFLVGVIVLLAVDFIRVTRTHPEYIQNSSTSTSSASSSQNNNLDPDDHLFHTSHIVLFISILLLIRQSFATTSLYPSLPSSPVSPSQTPISTHKLTLIVVVSEHRWYTLLAIPEFVVVALFSWPGLEPPHVYRVPEPIEDDSDSDSDSESV